MKEQDYKFELNQDIALKEDCGLSPWARVGKVFRISQRFRPHEQMGVLNRYRIQGLWFNEDEIFNVTKEENPEYYL